MSAKIFFAHLSQVPRLFAAETFYEANLKIDWRREWLFQNGVFEIVPMSNFACPKLGQFYFTNRLRRASIPAESL